MAPRFLHVIVVAGVTFPSVALSGACGSKPDAGTGGAGAGYVEMLDCPLQPCNQASLYDPLGRIEYECGVVEDKFCSGFYTPANCGTCPVGVACVDNFCDHPDAGTDASGGNGGGGGIGGNGGGGT